MAQVVKLPTIERRSSARSINDILKSIGEYSFEKNRILRESFDYTPQKVKYYSAKTVLPKVNTEFSGKVMVAVRKPKQITANTMATEASKGEAERCQQQLAKKVQDIRGLISKMLDKDARIPAMRSHREFRYSIQSLEPKYPTLAQDKSKQVKTKAKQIQTKIRQVSMDLRNFQYFPIPITPLEVVVKVPAKKSKSKPKKPRMELVNAARKVNKPLQSVSKEMQGYNFDQELSPWDYAEGDC